MSRSTWECTGRGSGRFFLRLGSSGFLRLVLCRPVNLHDQVADASREPGATALRAFLHALEETGVELVAFGRAERGPLGGKGVGLLALGVVAGEALDVFGESPVFFALLEQLGGLEEVVGKPDAFAIDGLLLAEACFECVV